MGNEPLTAVSTSAPAAEPAGDQRHENAGDEIYREYAPLLRRIAVRKFHIPAEDADALVHDVFVNCLLTTRNVRGDLRPYLVAAICNACRNYWRSRRTEKRVFADDSERPATADVAAADVYDGLAVNLVVASTLAKLGARCRELLRRYYLNGEDTVSIADAMETTPSNVNYLMHVCRKHARIVYDAITRVR
jgi:RNA polymerase sigma factor (sigma-70 family)